MVRNWINYSLVLIFAILFVLLNGEKISYATMYAVLLLPFMSWIIAFISKFYFKFMQSINSDFVLKGDDVLYTIKLDNKSIFSYSHIKVIFNERLEHYGKLYTNIEDKTFGLSSKKVKKINFNIKCIYRGMFEIGADYIEFMDMLGLFKYRFPIREKLKLLVYPRIIEINNFPFSFARLSKSQSSYDIVEEDYSSISDIRKYQDSDNYKKIHWKLSAKKRELLVKNFQTSVISSTIMFMDLKEVPIEVEDKLVESVISVIDYCLKKMVPVELHYFADRYEVLHERSASGFFNIYSSCANVKFEGDEDLHGIFREFTSKLTDYTNLIVFTSSLSGIFSSEIIKANNFGHNVILFCIPGDTRITEPGVIENIKNSGVFCFEGSSQDLVI